jgi:hypothetical protein
MAMLNITKHRGKTRIKHRTPSGSVNEKQRDHIVFHGVRINSTICEAIEDRVRLGCEYDVERVASSSHNVMESQTS